MNKLALLFMTSAVITASLMARASDEVSIPVKSIKFNQETMMLKMVGQMPSPCIVAPRPALVKTEKAETLKVVVMAQDTAEVCAAVMGGLYTLAFDIRSLKFELNNLGLNPEGTYKIVSADGSLATEVNFGEYDMVIPYASTEFVGDMLTVEDNGRFVVTVDEHVAFEVRNSMIDFNKFAGQEVTISGHLVKAKTPGFQSGVSERTFLVTGINATTR